MSRRLWIVFAVAAVVTPLASGTALAYEDFIIDDGSYELHIGDREGVLVCANKFVPGRAVLIGSISHYTAVSNLDNWLDIIIYEDPTGIAEVPDGSMEVWRRQIKLEGDKGRWHETLTGGVLVNASGNPDAAFFVGVKYAPSFRREIEPPPWQVGLDKTPPYNYSSFFSFDGGDTFLINDEGSCKGNLMIRAHEGEHNCWDEDEDGFEDEFCGGLDCDDYDPNVYPGAPETQNDGIDSNCNGQEKCFIESVL